MVEEVDGEGQEAKVKEEGRGSSQRERATDGMEMTM